jgi:hypothetical protein
MARTNVRRWGLPLCGLCLALLIPPLLWRGARPSAPRLASTDESEITGYVRDDSGPVAGARVRIQTCPRRTRTDGRGRFRLARQSGSKRVAAWKEGYFIGGTRLGDSLSIRLTRLPQEDFADYAWVDPAPSPSAPHNCGNCHAEIYREWAQSGHSQSASGRRFRNLYEGTNWDGDAGVGWGLLNEHPLGAGVCASCHAPSLADGDAAMFDLRQLTSGVASRGVHCDFCHKISGVSNGTLGLTHGRYNLEMLRPRRGQLFFGPLDDVDRGEDAYSPLYHDSRYCASCHEGILFGVHVYSTYSEWLASPARRRGQQCQDCHMKPTGRLNNVAPGHGGLQRDPRTLGNHRFFAPGRATMLRRCLRVEATIARRGEEASAVVRIGVADVGHRVPTGFLDRHLLLVVQGQTENGQTLPPRSGPRLPPAAGDLAGQPGRLYAKLHSDFEGHTPAPFWRTGPPLSDNRLSPEQTDELTFRFPVQVARLRVRVLYREFWQEVAHAKDWPDRDLTVFDRAFQSLPPSRAGSAAE